VPIDISLLLSDFVKNVPVLKDLNRLPMSLFCFFLGLGRADDTNFKRWFEKNRGNGGVLLSNSVSILDAFYFIATYHRLSTSDCPHPNS
jgi:hypothetical protein